MKKLIITIGFLLLATSSKAQKISISPVVSFGLGTISYFNAEGERVKSPPPKSSLIELEYVASQNLAAGYGWRFSIDMSKRFNLNIQTGTQYYKGEVHVSHLPLSGIGDGVISATPDFKMSIGNVDYEQHHLYFTALPEFVLIPEQKLYVNLGIGINIPIKDGYTSSSRPAYTSIFVIEDNGNFSYELSDFDTEIAHPYRLMFNVGTALGKGRLKFLGELSYTYLPAKRILDPGAYTAEFHYLPIVEIHLYQMTMGVSYALD